MQYTAKYKPLCLLLCLLTVGCPLTFEIEIDGTDPFHPVFISEEVVPVIATAVEAGLVVPDERTRERARMRLETGAASAENERPTRGPGGRRRTM